MKYATRGFTLIELLITVALVAIAATLAIPAFSSLVRGNQATARANELVAALNFTRSEAIARAVEVSLCASTNPNDPDPTCSGSTSDWVAGWVSFVDNDGDEQHDSGEQVLRIWEGLPAGVTLNTAVEAVRFTPRGTLADASNVDFTLKPTGECTVESKREIQINAVGRSEVKRGTC